MAQVFMGSFRMQVDGKGRVGLPSKYKSILRELCPEQVDSVGVMITPDRSIKVMPYPYFLEEIERWSRMDEHNAYEMMVRNMNTSIADTMALDNQNRFKLNQMMMDLCGIELQTQVVVSGCMDHMRIYNEQVYYQALNNAFSLSQQQQQTEATAGAAPIQQPDGQPVVDSGARTPRQSSQGQFPGGWGGYSAQPMMMPMMMPMVPVQPTITQPSQNMMTTSGQEGFGPATPPVAPGFSQMGTPQQENK